MQWGVTSWLCVRVGRDDGVLSRGDDKNEISMLASAQRGVDQMHIGLQLICQKAQQLVCRFATNDVKIWVFEESCLVIRDCGLTTHGVGAKWKITNI